MSKKRFGRRDLLEWVGAGAVGSAATIWMPGCSGSSGSGANPGGTEKVIVVGAGVAGLTIGNALTTAGIETIVLEARERIGGRVWSEDVGGVPIDLGGAWLSGPKGSPTACILNHEGLGWTAAEPFDLSSQLYDASLQRHLSLQELLPLVGALEDFGTALPSLTEALGPTATYADAITTFLDQAGLEGDARRHADFALQTEAELGYAQSSDLISLVGYDFSNAFPGGEHFPDGSYRGLTSALARGVEVQLGTVVSRIEHGEEGVIVETSKGAVTGSHVVVTVPLGVLKAGAIEFSPALPTEKTTAIERLDMAQLEKVVLRYDEAFWQSPDSGNFLYVSEQPGEFPLYVDYTRYAGDDPTLVILYCGDFGRAIAGMSDDEIASRAVDVVGEMTGETGRTPHTTRVTRWKSDPYAFGSYVYLPVGASVADIEALASPVGERLLFSGEATSRDYSGYVHGGILSGIREAERLLGTEGMGVELESGLVIQAGCDETAS